MDDGEPDPDDYDDDALYMSDLAEWSAAEPSATDYPDEEAFEEAHTDWTTSTENANEALDGYVADYDDGVEMAESDVELAEEQISEEALIEAMVAGLNATGAGPVENDDMTEEMIDWVSDQVGVTYDEFGDVVEVTDGFIDDYIGMETEDDSAEIDPVEIDEDEVVTELVTE